MSGPQLISFLGCALLFFATKAFGLNVYENSEITFTDEIVTQNPYELANTFDVDFYIKNKKTGVQVAKRSYNSDGTISFTVNLEPGVYERYSSGRYKMRYTVEEQYTSYNTAKVTFTVLDSPQPPYQVLPYPLVLSCTTNFDLTWEAVPVNPDFADKVFYKIEERSASVGESMPETWAVIASNYSGTAENGYDATHLSLSEGKATQKNYQFRVSSSYVLNGHQSGYSEPKESSVITKPACSHSQDFDAFTDITGASDKLTIAPANASGISINTLNALNVTRTFDILNFGGGGAGAAELIVLKVSSADIKSHVRVLGEAADLLIINTNQSSSSLFRCLNCSFENVNRLTLAQANESLGLNPSASGLGRLLTSNNTTMTVSGLTAPGVLSLELFTGKLDLQGVVSTNLVGRRNTYTGEYEINYSGDLAFAAGAFSAYIGGLAVDYESLEIISVWPRDINNYNSLNTSTIHGNIESLGVNIATTENLNLKSVLATDADVITTNTYRNKLYVPAEGIKVQSMGRFATLNIESAVSSDSRIDIHSIHQLNINNDITTDSLSLVSVKDINIKSGVTIRAGSFEAGAEHIENNGNILGAKINLNAQNSILNRFGGRIRGRDVAIVSLNGVVRNGSLTPYKPADETAYSTSQFGEAYQHGSYYHTTNKGVNGEKQSDLTAHIFANTVKIKANTIENVNPYFVIKKEGEDWDDGIAFSSRLLSQVAIYAAQNLSMEASGRILNSSAELVTIDPQSQMNLSAGQIINERYRTDLIADFSSIFQSVRSDEADIWGDYKTADVTQEFLNIQHLVSSPPASLYAAGSTSVLIEQRVTNDHSFIEMMGPARFEPRPRLSGGIGNPVIKSIGVMNPRYNRYRKYDRCGNVEQQNPQAPPTCVITIEDHQHVYGIKTDETLFIGHSDVYAVGVGLDQDVKDALRDFIATATDSSSITIDRMSNNELANFIRQSMDAIQEFLAEIKSAVQSAWDSMVDWFS